MEAPQRLKHYIIGPYPPPLGGVSVFAYRYARLLRDQGNEVEIVDFAKCSLPRRAAYLLRFALDPRYAVFHLNTFSFRIMATLLFRPFAGKIVFQDHSGRAVETLKGRNRRAFKLFLAKADEIVLVGEHIIDQYEQQGFPLQPDKVRVQNAFLPPPADDEPGIWSTYDPETVWFAENHKPLIVANAYKIVFHKDVDLYGLDMCVDLVAELKNAHPQVGLLFALAEIGDETYYREINRRIDELGIRENFHFMTGQKELWPLLRKSDLMVRPTFSDGYGISIAEALHFGCPAAASDVCARPEGTVLFSNRDARDFLSRCQEVLDR